MGFLATLGFFTTVVLAEGLFLAGEAARLRVATAFPAEDFFPVEPVDFVVEVLRVTDFFLALVFMIYRIDICLS